MCDKFYGKLRQQAVDSGALEAEHLVGSFIDPHIGCPAWPNCDLDHQGCIQVSSNPSFYGHQ